MVAEVRYSSDNSVQFTMADIPVNEKLEKFVEDVKYGSNHSLLSFVDN